MKKIIVIGGGAAGLMAAIHAAKQGAQVTVLEKMNRVGKKMLITGKGRCNITNNADIPTIIKNMTGNGKFLYSAIHQYSNDDVVAFFHELGVPTKIERGGRIFPESDKAADVVGAMLRALHRLNVSILTEEAVAQMNIENQKIVSVKTQAGKIYFADAVILATGGASYPGTGSTGDGYSLAEQVGHSIVEIRPSLVPLEVEEEWIKELQGLSLRNVRVTVFSGETKIGEDFGEMIFTHFGVSGPIILSLSKVVDQYLMKNKTVNLSINLKPALTIEMLDKRIQRDFEKFSRKQIKNSLGELLPAKLIDIVIDLSYIDPDKPIHQITKEERTRLIEVIMGLTITITRTRPIAEAIVTTGGVNVREINPKTMESKLVENLYFAGEVIDIDGYTGGFNLQAAFSTGYIAGQSAANDD
ncbi:BaiN/RdsA family NAD(P)/FAD-dependent oxidoreductase [Anaerosinus massiliensis]|uniref:NAD(P)/FAD-dependent oxidoreductase n=1 Tax=Massilibacillus massiliensis TaxID=1806837 RepID=UPI000AA76890|nr:NAD(P)/FAD-dependent oxidoreductase [Massilibacillus massiliensis]